MRTVRVLAAELLFALATVSAAQAQDPDYANPQLWLCRPDLKVDTCHVDLTATVVPGSGKLSIEKFKPASAPKIDCFYVYPTVSFDPGYQSDLIPGREEADAVREQFARFGSVCRLFAPVYRQYTLTALRARSGGPKPTGAPPEPGIGGYNDVRDAWSYYMSHFNAGRGVVLIGHSQGAGLLSQLLAREIDGKPVQKQLVSAILLGMPVMVPEGKDVGGTFKSIPLCHSDDQTGCVISYVTFRDTNPPPATSFFGRSRDGLVASCNNPANLVTGTGEPKSYFLTKGFLNNAGGQNEPDWVTPHQDIASPFVTTPGLITTTCVHQGDFTYLSLHVNAVPSDPRTDNIAGEVIRASGPDLNWGLHIIDMDHSIGSLLHIVGKQGEAWPRRDNPSRSSGGEQ